MNKGLNEPEIADGDFRRERGRVSDAELARMESADTTWNPDKSPKAMDAYNASLLAAGGEYAALAKRRIAIAALMEQGMDFEEAQKAAK
jgi:hypothetical protein